MMVPFITKDGVQLSLSEDGQGLPMVFQHGLCGDAGQPSQVFPNDSGYRRLTLECRGHGVSQAGSVDEFSIAAFAEDVAAMIDDKAQGPVVVGGISMGAAIALRLAVKRPELVSALVLARPAWLTGAAPENMAPNKFVGELLREHTQEQARALFETSPTAHKLSVDGPDNLASLRGFFTRLPSETTSELLVRISGDGPGVEEADLCALKVPVLIIGHRQDFVHPIAYAQKLADMIPNAQFVEITPKAQDPSAYRNDFRFALTSFLKGL